MEPAFIVFCSPYGGLGLKTKSAEAARRRVDGLLAACAVGPQLSLLELEVAEPCPRPLIEAMYGVLQPNTAFVRGHKLTDPADTIARASGHSLDAVAAEAWASFGLPGAAAARQIGGATWVAWQWQVEQDPVRAAAAYDPWFGFLARHQAMRQDDYAQRVGLRARWTLRLRTATGEVGSSACRESQISAYLSGRHASAFFDLAFPYERVNKQFLDDYHAVCTALGMKLPASRFRLDAPTKDGKGRRRTKLPAFA